MGRTSHKLGHQVKQSSFTIVGEILKKRQRDDLDHLYPKRKTNFEGN